MSDKQQGHPNSLISSGNRGLVTRSSSLARRGLEALQAQQDRVVHFPSNRSMGKLYVRSREAAPEENWEEFGEAQGKVTVPAKKDLRLDVSTEASINLSSLAALNSDDLQSLDLSSTRVSNAELEHIQGLASLRELFLSCTEISDTGLLHLKNLHELELLDLEDTQITDAGLVHLQKLTRLETLQLTDTQVSEVGVAELQHVLPRCKISWELIHVISFPPDCSMGTLYVYNPRSKRWEQKLGEAQGHVRVAAKGKQLALVINNEALVDLSPLRSLKPDDLQLLYFSNTPASSHEMVYLRELTDLQGLDLSNTRISDVGLYFLFKLTKLKWLNLSNTKVSRTGATALQRALPNCRIFYQE
jgi:hypothetical protein